MPKSISLEQAASALIQEKIIAYPTETFYAIGGLALSPTAAAAVFAAKGRPPVLPLPVIIGEIGQLPLLAQNISDAELELAQKFWPGPLSILFKAGKLLPPELLCGSREVAVRLSPHPAAAELCRLVGPLSGSSANLSGEPAVIDPSLLSTKFSNRLAGVLASPPPPGGGLPSTLVRALAHKQLQILRAGAISPEQLREAGWEIAAGAN